MAPATVRHLRKIVHNIVDKQGCMPYCGAKAVEGAMFGTRNGSDVGAGAAQC